MTLRISVIIPNLNSPVIDQTLESLRHQDFDLSHVEVLVIGLDEPRKVQPDELVRLISTSVPVAPAVARNIGIRQARGDLLCFMDADCVPEKEWLSRLVAPFTDEKIHVVGGGVSFEAKNYWTLCDNLSWFHEYLASTKEGEREQLPSLNLCVRRSVVDIVGPFDETKRTGEDTDWTVRMRQAGYILNFVPNATVQHLPARNSLKAIWWHAYIFGTNTIKIDPTYTDFLHTPVYLQKWWFLLVLAPIAAGFATLRIYLVNHALWGYWYAAPGVYVGKLAWTLGAVRSLFRRR
jgi:GT2 family glycosyltransferase